MRLNHSAGGSSVVVAGDEVSYSLKVVERDCDVSQWVGKGASRLESGKQSVVCKRHHCL